MLSSIIQTNGTDLISMILPLLLCCMIPFLFRQPSQPQAMSESDTWFVISGTEATYNVIVEEIDNWRE
ncbi:MAG: hypothetical protein JSV20_07975, partial [Candidatus Bathyarchaeota archaeon]